jgi:hypothetical protein
MRSFSTMQRSSSSVEARLSGEQQGPAKELAAHAAPLEAALDADRDLGACCPRSGCSSHTPRSERPTKQPTRTARCQSIVRT